MSEVIITIFGIFLMPILSPFFYGFLGINVTALFSLLVLRYSHNLWVYITIFILSLLNDVTFHLLFGSTFISIYVSYIFDIIIKRVIPNETRTLDLIFTTISFFLFYVSLEIFMNLSSGSGFRAFENFQELASSLLYSFIMSSVLLLISMFRTYFSGGTGHKIIKL
ncbi:hypothetical protein HYV12_01065 [Candidatus Dojkabacteria bacterium]|nr:hypothetical protein [Candidatus Dojkabacteria bacterium]